MGSQHGGYPPKNVKFWIFGAPRRMKMCCSILNTILNDVKYLGEGLQKISWTLLMIKDRQNGKNLPPPPKPGFWNPGLCILNGGVFLVIHGDILSNGILHTLHTVRGE